ncbi:hypothetical protein GQ457_01G045520 [Hibiscus cannabinus]
MAISSSVFAEMEIPTAHFEDLPKLAGNSPLVPRSVNTLEIANRIKAAVHVWKQKDQRKHMNQHQSLALKGLVADNEKVHKMDVLIMYIIFSIVGFLFTFFNNLRLCCDRISNDKAPPLAQTLYK